MYYKDCSKTFIDYVNAALERLNYLSNSGNIALTQQNNALNSSINAGNPIQSKKLYT